MKVINVVGARPNFMKIAPILNIFNAKLAGTYSFPNKTKRIRSVKDTIINAKGNIMIIEYLYNDSIPSLKINFFLLTHNSDVTGNKMLPIAKGKYIKIFDVGKATLYNPTADMPVK